GRIGIPDDVKDEIVRPLTRKLKRLAKKCRELGDAIDEELLDRLQDIGDLPDLDLDDVDDLDLDGLTGSAAGSVGAGATDEGPGLGERLTGWVGGLLGFVGWSS
nr:hypothetical protein [Actinomycetota bacterium]